MPPTNSEALLALSSTAAAPGRPQSDARRAALLGHCAVAILFAANALRLLRHAMWRDELQAFMIARASASPLDLLHNLKYEGHPALWHLLLWLATRVTGNPAAMQFLELGIAAGIWLLVCCASPFGWAEKFLLLLGYFLFWEYFVLSRSYSLMALLGFAFVALRIRAPERIVPPWILLGLLANTVVYASIWSMVLAGLLGLEQMLSGRAPRRWIALGGAIYLLGLGAAILTMLPAPDQAFQMPFLSIDPLRALAVVATVLGAAFVPISGAWLHGAAGGFSSDAANFWNPNIIADFGAAGLPFAWAGLFGAAAAGRALARDRSFAAIVPIAQVAATVIGVCAFGYVWGIVASRHCGVLFLSVAAAVWLKRAERPSRAAPWWIALLVINAVGGLATLQAGPRPFSAGEAAALWLRENGLDQSFLIGSRDAEVSTVAGYLGPPVYYLECECEATYVAWNRARRDPLDGAEMSRRLARAVEASGRDHAILILNQRLDAGGGASELPISLLQTFTGAALSDENYFVYRVDRPAAGAMPPRTPSEDSRS
jgi:hypothetical protein